MSKVFDKNIIHLIKLLPYEREISSHEIASIWYPKNFKQTPNGAIYNTAVAATTRRLRKLRKYGVFEIRYKIFWIEPFFA